MVTKLAFVVGLAMLAGASPLLAQNDPVGSALDRLVAAYPDALAGHDGKALRWRDGTLMPASDGGEQQDLRAAPPPRFHRRSVSHPLSARPARKAAGRR